MITNTDSGKIAFSFGSGEKDYYEILGLRRDATQAEINSAYREVALKYHPRS